MTPSETAEILALAAAYDQRTVGTADALAWAAVLEHIDPTDARQAVIDHYRATRDRIMPADVINRVRAIRQRRLTDTIEDAPDADPDDPAAYLTALRQGRAITASSEPTRPRPVQALAIGQPMPKPDYGAAPRRARELLAKFRREQAATKPQPQPEQPATTSSEGSEPEAGELESAGAVVMAGPDDPPF